MRVRNLLPPLVAVPVGAIGVALLIFGINKFEPAKSFALSPFAIATETPKGDGIQFRISQPTVPSETISIAQRPLFDEQRLPRQPILKEEIPEIVGPQEMVVEEPVVFEPEVIAPDPPQVEIHGFMNVSGVNRVLLLVPQQGLEQWFEVGDSIDGWEIREVGQRYITLVLGDTQHIVELYPDR